MKLNPWVTNLEEEAAFSILDKASTLKAHGKPVLNLGIGQPDFTPPAHILAAAEKAVRDGPHGYSSPTGIPPLRDAVSEHVNARYDCNISSDQVVIVPGGKVTFYFATLLFGGPGSEILYPDPGFPPYREALRSSGAVGIPYPVREEHGFAFSAEDVLRLITPRTRLIILNSPANPTGGVTPAEELEKFAKGLAKYPDVAILSDEIYSHLIYQGARYVSLLQFSELADRTIVLDGWSKTFAMPGWRLGFGIWPQSLVPHIRKLITANYSCVNHATQMAGIAALTGPMDDVISYRKTLATRRDLFVEGLNAIPGITCQTPGGAFYAFPNITSLGFSSYKLADKLLNQAYIATIPGDAFGYNGHGYLRLSYAAPENELELALTRIQQFVQTQKN